MILQRAGGWLVARVERALAPDEIQTAAAASGAEAALTPTFTEIVVTVQIEVPEPAPAAIDAAVVRRILKGRRWPQRDAAFTGFGSPRGRF